MFPAKCPVPEADVGAQRLCCIIATVEMIGCARPCCAFAKTWRKVLQNSILQHSERLAVELAFLLMVGTAEAHLLDYPTPTPSPQTLERCRSTV